MKNSKFMRGIGRDSTETYSSLKRLLICPLSESSAQGSEKRFSSVRSFMKYGASRSKRVSVSLLEVV